MSIEDGSGTRGRWRTAVTRTVTILAAVLVLLALIAPDRISHITPGAFVRIPLEGLVIVVLILVLPSRAGRIVAAGAGVVLGLLSIVKILDVGFYAAFARPFDPVIDWTFLGPAVEFLKRSIGVVGAVIAVVVAVVLAAGVPILLTLSTMRLRRVLIRHRTVVARTVGVLGVAWLVCALVGAQIIAGVPVASTSAAGLAVDQLRQVRADVLDQRSYAAEAAEDPFHDVPGEQLLTALRGKDVLLTFVESYGRVATQDPDVSALLDSGTDRLRAAGFTARSGFLTSSTAGGGSWLAHSTLQSGLWINNPQRYSELVKSDRLTLTRAFLRGGWRTVGVDPANREDWPEATFYGYNQIYDARNIGYRGPDFNFASIPDQYTLSAFQRLERATPNHHPVMAEIDLLSSHAPWSPIPTLMDWTKVGDGSGFDASAGAGDPADIVLQRDVARVRADYMHSIEYSLSALISYVQTYGDDNLVLVFLGDHEPAPVITGDNADRDVPITIVARDRAIVDRLSGWGWTDGLKPSAQAPTWRMNAFRDHFLAALGPQAQALPLPPPPAPR